MLGHDRLSCSSPQLIRDLETMPKTPGRRAALARVRKLDRALGGTTAAPRSGRAPA